MRSTSSVMPTVKGNATWGVAEEFVCKRISAWHLDHTDSSLAWERGRIGASSFIWNPYDHQIRTLIQCGRLR